MNNLAMTDFTERPHGNFYNLHHSLFYQKPIKHETIKTKKHANGSMKTHKSDNYQSAKIHDINADADKATDLQHQACEQWKSNRKWLSTVFVLWFVLAFGLLLSVLYL